MELYKHAHLKWVDRLREMLVGKVVINVNDVTGPTECILGQWYYGAGKEQLGELAEFQAVERPHARIHSAVREAVEAYNKGDIKKAELVANDVERLGHEVVDALNRLESGMKARM